MSAPIPLRKQPLSRHISNGSNSVWPASRRTAWSSHVYQNSGIDRIIVLLLPRSCDRRGLFRDRQRPAPTSKLRIERCTLGIWESRQMKAYIWPMHYSLMPSSELHQYQPTTEQERLKALDTKAFLSIALAELVDPAVHDSRSRGLPRS